MFHFNLSRVYHIMGVDVYAVSDTHQEEMVAELQSLCLNENLRRCNIAIWKAVFEYCTLVSINSLQWEEVSFETVQSYSNMCNQVIASTPIDFEMKFNQELSYHYHDLVILQTYLNTILQNMVHV